MSHWKNKTSTNTNIIVNTYDKLKHFGARQNEVLLLLLSAGVAGASNYSKGGISLMMRYVNENTSNYEKETIIRCLRDMGFFGNRRPIIFISKHGEDFDFTIKLQEGKDFTGYYINVFDAETGDILGPSIPGTDDEVQYASVRNLPLSPYHTYRIHVTLSSFPDAEPAPEAIDNSVLLAEVFLIVDGNIDYGEIPEGEIYGSGNVDVPEIFFLINAGRSNHTASINMITPSFYIGGWDDQAVLTQSSFSVSPITSLGGSGHVSRERASVMTFSVFNLDADASGYIQTKHASIETYVPSLSHSGAGGLMVNILGMGETRFFIDKSLGFNISSIAFGHKQSEIKYNIPTMAYKGYGILHRRVTGNLSNQTISSLELRLLSEVIE